MNGIILCFSLSLSLSLQVLQKTPNHSPYFHWVLNTNLAIHSPSYLYPSKTEI